jgi:PPOX class probable F420-dependent enzyme
MVPEQRRGRVIAMSADELTSFLGEQRTCRFATTGPDGPHVAPVWFVWDGQALWVYSLTRSQRWANLARDPRVAVVVDDGHHYHELRGVEVEGEAVMVGPVPRTGGEDQPAPELAEPERLMAAKYFGPAHQAAADVGGASQAASGASQADPANPAASAGGASQAADGASEMVHDGRHAWLRITPDKIVSWDFRKLATLPGRSPESGG